jgi:hypothetical protein
VRGRARHWLAAAPLTAAASLGGHEAGYRLAAGGSREAALHGYLQYAPLVLSFLVSLLVLAFGLRLRGGLPGQPSARLYGLLPPLVYATQEALERLLAGAELHGLLHPPVLVGLAAQLPFALAAYAVARLLLRCADAVAALLRSERLVPCAAADAPIPASLPAPRPRLADGSGFGRAPPRR